MSIICPIKRNIKAYKTWKEANEQPGNGVICVLFAFNEFKEPRFIKAKPGQIFTMNLALRFQHDYFLCMSKNAKDCSFVNESDVKFAEDLIYRDDLLNPLMQSYFQGVHTLQKVPTSTVLVKISPSGEEVVDNVTRRRLIDVQETILQDLRKMVEIHNAVLFDIDKI